MSDSLRLDPAHVAKASAQTERRRETESAQGQSGLSFAQLLRQATQSPPAERLDSKPIVLSNHAVARLQSRGVYPTQQMLSQVAKATDLLAAKNAHESFVAVSGVGFVVNVKNRTVVTAMPLHDASAHVFTNIDSAVWMDGN